MANGIKGLGEGLEHSTSNQIKGLGVTMSAQAIADAAQARRAELEGRLGKLDAERATIKSELALLPAARKARKPRSDRGKGRARKAEVAGIEETKP